MVEHEEPPFPWCILILSWFKKDVFVGAFVKALTVKAFMFFSLKLGVKKFFFFWRAPIRGKTLWMARNKIEAATHREKVHGDVFEAPITHGFLLS